MDKRNKLCTSVKEISFTDLSGIFNVYDLAQKVIDDGCIGDMAEAGVTAGANPIIMNHVCMINGVKNKKIRLFDSFCGHPTALESEHDDLKKLHGIRDKSGKLYNIKGLLQDVQNVKDMVLRYNADSTMMEYHPGYFQESFMNLPDFKLCLLRVDVNLFESHKLCMKYLYPRLVSGGYFISDDYISPDIKNDIDTYLMANQINYSVIGSENHIIYWKKP